MFTHLNDKQREAVLTTTGRVLILAGAGSGKTSVLTHRIAHLISQGTPPESILGLTFTNKAATEMRQRVAKLIPAAQAKKVQLCTFHSFCMQILRKEITHLGYTTQFSLYDEQDVKRLTQSLARHLLETEGELPSLEKTLDKLLDAKAKGVSPRVNLPENPTWHDTFSCDLYDHLKTSMRAYNAVDFDGLLLLTLELFEKFPAVLEKYQERFRYIMIDEYQDTNPIQYRLAHLLSLKYGNLCVVGDDDQSIYGWRGAEVKNILEFEANTVIRLEQNYRSIPTILQAANAVIANNQKRHSKTLWSAFPSSHPITLFHAPTEMEEAQSVVQRMVLLRKEQNIPWKEMAILYRSNLLSRPFELALKQALYEKEGAWVRGIPFRVFGGTSFFEYAEIKDLIAYLRVIANPLDQEALLRIINVPRRGISTQTLDLLTQWNRQHNIPLWNLLEEIASPLSSSLKMELSSTALAGISTFVKLIQEAQDHFATSPLHEAFSQLIDTIDYKKAIADHTKTDQMKDFKWENVAHCVDALSIYEEEAESPSLADFLSSTSLDKEFRKESSDKGEDAVNLMTFHSAKGLEFKSCYLVALEDHIIPHEKSLMDTGLEEERRLMYVALTRAKQYLSLSMARKRKRLGKEVTTSPSRFLFEIPKDLLRVTSWQVIDY
ncbi:MAG: putative helicase [Chlamydiota bacterium]|jgi:superfamily I DNA/RNA helicase